VFLPITPHSCEESRWSQVECERQPKKTSAAKLASKWTNKYHPENGRFKKASIDEFYSYRSLDSFSSLEPRFPADPKKPRMLKLRILHSVWFPLLCMVRTRRQIPEVGCEGYSTNDERREQSNDGGDHLSIIGPNSDRLNRALTVRIATIPCIPHKLWISQK
jgi:hypothetical protein